MYHNPGIKDNATSYAKIVDESMMLGSEKMLLVLGVDAKKTGDKSLRKQDAEILNIALEVGILFLPRLWSISI
ncbi:MAG: hypothetical protein LBS69_00510 [Prevotellaceae bacterium]|nr:hypothetical protein [Prevotellaceae bacterium]